MKGIILNNLNKLHTFCFDIIGTGNNQQPCGT